MKKIIALASLLTFLITQSFSQIGSGKITGTVIDGNTRTIESATISLLKAKDSSLSKMSVADKTGRFEFAGITPGRYLVKISAVGHTPGYTELFELAEGGTVVLKTLELVPEAKAIGAVTVTAKRPLIEQKLDRTIVNVEASITNVGSSALEVLEKSPGITVDKDGNISLKGKQGVVVMIDGRPSYLSGPELANLLRSMNANQLDQIEIMTNPPARFDASGNSGVINIKTKKNRQFGYNGSLTTGFTYGRFARFNEGGTFNYRNGKFNVFTNLNYNSNHRGEDLDIIRNIREAGTKELISVFDQVTEMENRSKYYSAKAGVDHFLSKKTSVGVVLSGFYNPSTWQGKTQTYVYEPTGSLISRTKAFVSNEEKWKNFSTNFNVRHQIDSTGQAISADLDYVSYYASSIQPLYSEYYDKFGDPSRMPDTLLGDLPRDLKIYSGKIDYSKPFKNGAKFEAGVKASYVETDNNAVYNNLYGGNSTLDSGRSNHFIYKEKIAAAYVNYSRKLSEKWSGQLGMRLETTNADGDSRGFVFSGTEEKFVPFNEKFSRNYTQLFPTMYLQYSANEKNQFVINYGRRINRPNYQDLNPFINFIDRYTFEQGNPNLRPQFSHNIELTHTYKGFLNTTLNYSTTNDIIQQVIEQNTDTYEAYIKKANIATRNQLGIAVSANKEITKWWSGNMYMNVSNNQFKGIVNNEPVAIGLTMMFIQAQQQFKWGKGWGAEISGWYRTKGVEGVIFIKPMSQMSVGFSKQILKNKGSIRLNIRDVYAGNRARGYSKYGNVDAAFVNTNDSRSVSLGFTWRFSKGKLKPETNRKSGSASDEQQRVGAGN